MNPKTDNMYIDDNRILNEETKRKRMEYETDASWLYEYLKYGEEIPEHILARYGLTNDYRLSKYLNRMDCEGIYKMLKKAGKVPDIMKVDARLERSVEKVFERICPHPPTQYLERLEHEMRLLGEMIRKEDYDAPVWYKKKIFAKYGIDTQASREVQVHQIEKAYRELDVRFFRVTGRKPDANELFGRQESKKAEVFQKKQADLFERRNRKSQGRKIKL